MGHEVGAPDPPGLKCSPSRSKPTTVSVEDQAIGGAGISLASPLLFSTSVTITNAI